MASINIYEDLVEVKLESTSDPLDTNIIGGRKVNIPSKYFEYVGEVPGKSKVSSYRCLLGCAQKFDKDGEPKFLHVCHSSRYNARRHIRSFHAEFLEQFDRDCNSFKGNVTKVSPIPQQSTLTHTYSRKRHTQDEFDNLILDYLITDVLPLSHVNQPGFRDLMTKLSPSLKLGTRNSYMKMLQQRFAERKQQLIKALEAATEVATTSNCWTDRGKSYIGITVHWFDNQLARQSACLAVRRIEGAHSFDVIARLIESIYIEFRISQKVTATTTDGGSSFTKAIQEAGRLANNTTLEELSDSETDDDENELVYFPLGDILDNNDIDLSINDSNIPIVLPPHRRCACHLLNLVARVDIGKITDKKFNCLRKCVETKLQTFWKKQSSRTKSSKETERHLAKLFAVKQDNMWTSMYNVMCRVQRFLSTKPDEFAKLLEDLNVPQFHPSESEYLKEYVKIMKPLVEALDVLQGQENTAISLLLPTLTVLKQKLNLMSGDSSLKYCKPLVTGLRSAVSWRFDHMFEESELMLASLSDPRFKWFWLPDSDRHRAKLLLKEEFNRQRENQNHLNQSFGVPENMSDESDSDGCPTKICKTEAYFSPLLTPNPQECCEVDAFLQEPLGTILELHNYPILRRVFRRYNAALPSSAAIENLFDVGGPIYQPRKSHISDSTFEMLLFLKVNSKVYVHWSFN